MAIRKIPTTADIYLEVDGVRVAVVQSYKVTASGRARPFTRSASRNR